MNARPAVTSQQSTDMPPSREAMLHRVGSISVPVSVQLCRRRLTLSELSALGPGSFIPFSATDDQPLKLCIDRSTIAEGEAVRCGAQLGLRLSRFVAEPAQR